MKLFLDFLPVILFVVTYWFSKDIWLATAVTVVVGILQTLYIWIKTKKLEKMQLFSLIIVIVMGGATLLLHDPIYIKWKPSVLYWAMSLVFLGSVILKKNVMQKLLSKELELPPKVWNRFTLHVGLFFAFLGALNLYVVYHFSDDVWVNFKLFGVLSLMIVFFISQFIYLSRYLKENSSDKDYER